MPAIQRAPIQGPRSKDPEPGVQDSFPQNQTPGLSCPQEVQIRTRETELETRPYFVLGDLAANIAAGVIIGLISALLFGPGWNMLLAMFVGMALGMVISLPIALGSGALFGAMEVMLPVMTTGMVVGMVVPMAAAMAEVSFAWAVRVGACCGVGVVIATYVANSLIKRRTERWTT